MDDVLCRHLFSALFGVGDLSGKLARELYCEGNLPEERYRLDVYAERTDLRRARAVHNLDRAPLQELSEVYAFGRVDGDAVWVSLGLPRHVRGCYRLELDVDFAVLARIVSWIAPVFAFVCVEGAAPVALDEVGGARVAQAHGPLQTLTGTW